ncbi:MAG TPA: superoxide dismutase family protein [Chloroflexota bacterium]|nr:superoxide dismutase family protein [Chloroflexota bacterium]
MATIRDRVQAPGVILPWVRGTFGATTLLALWLIASLPTAEAAQLFTATASADLRDRLSRFIGTVMLREESGGVHLTADLRNLPPGAHGFHIDNVGQCVSPSFLSAGSIFNPTGKRHGLRNPAGPQVGDLPSLTVAANGTATLDLVVPGASLTSGPTSLFGGSGTALVVYANDDDQVTEPEGGAGERMACGVILPTDAAAVSATAQARSPALVAANSTVAATVAKAAPASAAASQVIPDSRGGPTFSPALVGIFGLVLLGAGYLMRRRAYRRDR